VSLFGSASTDGRRLTVVDRGGVFGQRAAWPYVISESWMVKVVSLVVWMYGLTLLL
jgi:hypothetical protein